MVILPIFYCCDLVLKIADNSSFLVHCPPCQGKTHIKPDVETTSHHQGILNLELDAKNEKDFGVAPVEKVVVYFTIRKYINYFWLKGQIIKFLVMFIKYFSHSIFKIASFFLTYYNLVGHPT